MHKNTVAVLGASGFIGGAVVRELRATDQYEVLEFGSRQADLTEADGAEILHREIPCGAVLVVASAARQPRDSIRAFSANAGIAVNVARLISMHGFRQAVFLSSVDVYGRTNLSLPLSELSPTKPQDYYAISKCAAELLIRKACEDRAVPCAILRLPGVYGPGDPSNRIVAAAVAALRTGSEMQICGDGRQKRDLLYVGDLSRSIEIIIRLRCAEGIFNMVTGNSVSVNEICDTLESTSGCRLRRVYNKDAAPGPDIVFQPSAILKSVPAVRFAELGEGLRLTWESRRRPALAEQKEEKKN